MAKNPSRKWASHAEWCYERGLLPVKALVRKLRTGRKTITAWDNGTRPVPHWAPQVLRLQRLDASAYLRALNRPDSRADASVTALVPWPLDLSQVAVANDAGGDHAAR